MIEKRPVCHDCYDTVLLIHFYKNNTSLYFSNLRRHHQTL